MRIDCSIGLQVIKILNIATDPLDLVLDGLGDEVDALQHVSDVVDSPLLHLQLHCCLIKVHLLVRRHTNQVNEFSGQLPQRVLLTSPNSGLLPLEKSRPLSVNQPNIEVDGVVLTLIVKMVILIGNDFRNALSIGIIFVSWRSPVIGRIFCICVDMLIILPREGLIHYFVIY